MKELCIFITSYNRHNSLKQIVKDLNHPWVVIIDDCSNPPIDIGGCEVIRTAKNNGKQEYWKNINLLLKYIRDKKVEHFLIIPDDTQVKSNWKEAYTQFKNLLSHEPFALAMSVINYRYRRRHGFTKETVQYNGVRYVHNQFVDGFFMGTRKMAELLNFQVEPIDKKRWERNPKISSGVWGQVTSRLEKHGNMYSVMDDFFEKITQTSKDSLMQKRSRWSRKIVASCSSFSKKFLERSLDSIIDQVDEVRVYLNGYDEKPDFLMNPKIKVYFSSQYGIKDDRGRFHGCEDIDGYHILFDEKYIYPQDYVIRLVEGIDKHSAVCGFHGWVLKKRKEFRSWQSAIAYVFHYKQQFDTYKILDIVDTAFMGYHSEIIRFDIDYPSSTSTNILASARCKQKRIPIFGLAHKENYIKRQTRNITLELLNQNFTI